MGEVQLYEEGQVKRYVNGFLFDSEHDSVVLIQKTKPLYQEGLLNGVGGKIEKEDLTEAHAVSREFMEETGMYVGPDEWTHFATLRGNNFEVVFFKAIRSGPFNLLSITDELVTRVRLSALGQQAIMPNLNWLLEMSMDRHETDWPYLIMEGEG